MNLARNKDAANAALAQHIKLLLTLSNLNKERKFEHLPESIYDELFALWKRHSTSFITHVENTAKSSLSLLEEEMFSVASMANTYEVTLDTQNEEGKYLFVLDGKEKKVDYPLYRLKEFSSLSGISSIKMM